MKDEEGAMTFVEEARGYMRAWLNSAHNMELVSYLNTACNTIETLERELAEARSLRAVADSNAAAARAELNAARQACNDEHPEVGQAYAAIAACRAAAGEQDIRLAGVEAERDHYRAALAEMTTKRDALFEEATTARRELATLREHTTVACGLLDEVIKHGVDDYWITTDHGDGWLHSANDVVQAWARREP